MKALFDSIFVEFESGTSTSTLRTLVSTRGMYHGRAPQGTVFPFVEVGFFSSDNEFTNTSTFRQPIVTFNAWDDARSPVAVNNIGDQVVAAYRDNLLSVTGFTTVRAEVVSESELEQPDQNGWNYQVEVQYDLGS